MDTEVISSFFPPSESEPTTSKNRSDDFLDLVDELNDSLDTLQLPATVHCMYNPTVYARATYEMYIKKYCCSKKRIMYFGMNPGPWGMSQTGVRPLLFHKSIFLHRLVYVLLMSSSQPHL